MSPSRQAKKYPGRDRVLARDDARDHLWRKAVGDSFAPWCNSPVELHTIGLPGFLDRENAPLPVAMRVACRKCEGCLRHRRNLWAARAADEIGGSRRTWFLTLTVSPENRFKLGLIGEKRYLRASSETLSDLTPEELYRLQCRVLSQELTLSLKRLRKKASFRFLAVFEHHKDGFPHIHAFIHEQREPLTKRSIQAEWRLGFSQCKLVDEGPKAAFYVAKYLSKEAATRIRASLRYGQSNQKARFITEALSELSDAVAATQRTERPPSSGESK